jgi:hypothetical protein
MLAASPLLARTSKHSDVDAKVAGFELTRLPPGKNVTLPRPATTFVPASERVTLTATDIPQSLSFRPVNLKTGRVTSLRLSIYDAGSDRVQYVDLRPGTPFLYNFKELSTITVIAGQSAMEGVELQVESDKPLEIAR